MKNLYFHPALVENIFKLTNFENAYDITKNPTFFFYDVILQHSNVLIVLTLLCC